jgi:hypothetical protein
VIAADRPLTRAEAAEAAGVSPAGLPRIVAHAVNARWIGTVSGSSGGIAPHDHPATWSRERRVQELAAAVQAAGEAGLSRQEAMRAVGLTSPDGALKAVVADAKSAGLIVSRHSSRGGGYVACDVAMSAV